MEKLRAGLEFIFSSYKRTAAILFIGALTLSIPITIVLVREQQDMRQQASEPSPTHDVDSDIPEAGKEQAQLTRLVSGDINQDNEINLLDYNMILSCYGDADCDAKILADLNEDGQIGELDLSILFAEFVKGVGD